MLAQKMKAAWNGSPVQNPAGRDELDALYLDAVAGGGVVVDSLDAFSLGCSSSLPPTYNFSCANTVNNCA